MKHLLRRLAALVGDLVADQTTQEVLAHGCDVPAFHAQAAPRPDRVPEVRGFELLGSITATAAGSRREKSRPVRSRCCLLGPGPQVKAWAGKVIAVVPQLCRQVLRDMKRFAT